MERESSEEPLKDELITPQILDGIEKGLNYQKQAWEKNPLNSIAVEMGQPSVTKTAPFLESVKMPDGYQLPFVKEAVLDELKIKLNLAPPKIKQGTQGRRTIELYRVRKPGETDDAEAKVDQIPAGLERSVKRHQLGETAFVEVLRDSRNGRIIDIETGYPYFRRESHYEL